MSRTWPYPGARWWKFDFHTHTPASMDTTAWQAAIATPDEVTPQKWLFRYMDAEIDCVAVTDHNSGEWIDRLKASYAEMKHQADSGNPPEGFRELHLFPGVEISVQGGFHLLAIFDPAASSQTISDLLAKVEYTGTRGTSDGVTREGAAKVVERILAEGGIAVPAHVDEAKGLLQVAPGTYKSLLDPTTVRQVLYETGILAIEQIASTSPAPMLVQEMKLRFASVVGSDCHSFQGNAVPGSRYTWIKMANPSLEGLRLALLDGQEISVRRYDESNGFVPFDTPEHFIKSIEIHNARFMGRGNTQTLLPLSPYFNALIGGRGTGKSTIVHALRLTYQRETELLPASEAAQTFNRFNKAAKTRNDDGGLLPDTKISIQVSRDDLVYRLCWGQDGQRRVEEWEPTILDFTPSDSQVINQQRFPIVLFSQGQIAALAGDSQLALLKVVDDGAGTRAQQVELEEAKRAFLTSRAQLRELEGKLRGRESLMMSLQDIQRKLARFESADHAVVLKNYQRTSQQRRELEYQFGAAAELAVHLKDIAAKLVPKNLPRQLFETPEDNPALEFVHALNAAIDTAKQEVENAARALKEHEQDIRRSMEASAWFAQIGKAKVAYDQLKSDLQQQGVNDPSEYGQLMKEKQRIDSEFRNLEVLQLQHANLSEKAKSQLEQVQTARRAISTKRAVFLQETLEGNPFVHIKLIPYSRDIQATERSLRELLRVGEGKFADDIYLDAQENSPAKGLLADLILSVAQMEKPGEWNTPAFEAAIQAQKCRIAKGCCDSGQFGAWFSKYLKGETEKHPEFIDHILCWFPEDGLQVEYSRKGDGKDFQSIGQASAGQRAAAMLAFLLAHGNEPLVLDQPEDDLDNHLIYSLVVQQIRSNKLRRQLIIVTHNPNIVVNGDAELIHVLDFNHQCHVKQTGSLQDKAMRREVCQVMEGGEEAFERRYLRLGREIT